MIRKKEVEKLPVLPAKAQGSEKWIGRIRMAEDVIVMDVYDARRIMCPEGEEKDAEISFRWVCDKKNFYTYKFQNKTWLQQGIYWAMHGYTGRCSSIDIKVDQESQKITEKFLEKYEKKRYWYRSDAANLLMELEEDIREEKRERRQNQREERIKKRQEARRPLPKDWDRWLQNRVFKEERYLFYDAKKRKQGNCAYCGAEVELDGTQKHNASGKCPACGSRVQFKAIGKTGSMRDRKQTIYLQRTDEGFLTRYIMAEKYSSPKGEKYKSYDCVLATWNGKKTWYDYCVVSGLTGNEYWDDSRPADMSAWKAIGHLYTRNVKQALKGTVFKYAPLAEWMRHKGEEIPFCDFMAKYENSTFLEFFIKAGLFRLTAEYVTGHYKWTGKNPQEILGIDKQRIRRLIKIDGGIIALGWMKYEQESGIVIKDELIGWMQENKIYADNCKNILKSLGSVIRMVNYMKKQSVPPAEVITTWEDYLRMAKDQGMDTTDDIVRFPKNLRQRHDQLVDIANEKKDQERLKEYAPLDQKIRERIPDAARYYWENEKYMIIPAGACIELIKEGRSLHHCVGRDDNYMKKMAAGTSWILFLRKKEDVDTPWYTIEVDMKDDRILQYYSMFDRKPEQEKVKKILDTFQRNVKRSRKKNCVRVPVSAIA